MGVNKRSPNESAPSKRDVHGPDNHTRPLNVSEIVQATFLLVAKALQLKAVEARPALQPED
jgi:hypothetical protein